MSATRIYAIVLRQFYLIRATPTRLIQVFVWGTLEIVLWGFITKYLSDTAGEQFGFVPLLLGAVLLWDFLTRVMQAVTTAFFEDVWSRNFLNVFGSPLSNAEYVAGLVIIGTLTSAVSFAVMVALAWLFFGFSAFLYGMALLPFVLVLYLSGVALGIFGVAIVLRFGPPAEWFIWPIPVILAPFVGVFYPLSTLPEWMRIIGLSLPPSYVFEGMRAVVLEGQFSGPALFFGAALASLFIVLAYALFESVYRRAMQSGLIARYSAESIG